MPDRIPSLRVAAPVETFLQQLGPLKELPGNWRGQGFNLIARPDFQGGNDIFLELNPTDEELHFSSIGGPIPNRGSVQDDIEIFGIHYLQQISDRSSGGAIHLEPGIWLNVPETTDPAEPATVVRMATIPHGTAVLIQGTSFDVPGPPRIGAANTVPFGIGGPVPPPGTPNGFPEYDLSQPNDFRTNPVPAGVTQAMVTNPNSLLADDITAQTITETTVLTISTAAGRAPNALAARRHSLPRAQRECGGGQRHLLDREGEVPGPHDDHLFLQLQYTQTVLRNFAGLAGRTCPWPPSGRSPDAGRARGRDEPAQPHRVQPTGGLSCAPYPWDRGSQPAGQSVRRQKVRLRAIRPSGSVTPPRNCASRWPCRVA